MSPPPRPVNYRLDLTESSASAGFFAAVPQNPTTFEAGIAHLCRHPNDSFMHAHLMECIGEMDLPSVATLLKSEAGSNPVVRSLVLESATINGHLSAIKGEFKRREINRLAEASPLVLLRSELMADQAIHRQWSQLFHANITRHRPLPPPSSTGLPLPVEGVDGSDAPMPDGAHLKAIINRTGVNRCIGWKASD